MEKLPTILFLMCVFYHKTIANPINESSISLYKDCLHKYRNYAD